MSLEAAGSILSSSWTVREVKAVAEEINKIESRVTKAIVAVSMVIIGPPALSILILMDAIRGVNFLVESLYWRDRSVEPSGEPLPVPVIAPVLPPPVPVIDPVKEILDEVKAIQAKAANPMAISPKRAMELYQRRMNLVESVLDQIQGPDMDENTAAEFLKQVIEGLKIGEKETERLLEYLGENPGAVCLDENEKPFSFETRFERTAFGRMRQEFLANFIATPLEAMDRLHKIGRVLEVLFPSFDKGNVLNEEDVIPVMNAIRSELCKNLDLEFKEQYDKAKELQILVDGMQNIGLPEPCFHLHRLSDPASPVELEDQRERKLPPVLEMHRELIVLDNAIQRLEKENAEIEQQMLVAYGQEIEGLGRKIQEGEAAILGLEAQLPKEKTIKREIDLKAEFGHFKEAGESLQRQIDELQKENEQLLADDQKFEELSLQLANRRRQLEADRNEHEQKKQALERIRENGFEGEAPPEINANLQEIRRLIQEIIRPLAKVNAVESPVRPEVSPDPLFIETPMPPPAEDTPTPSPAEEQGWMSWLRSWVY